MIFIDYFKLDECKRQHKYLLMINDSSSNKKQVFPTKFKSSRADAEIIFNSFCFDFGFPERILHNQVKEFDDKMFKQLEEFARIEQSCTSP